LEKEKITKKIRISLGRKKPKNLFNELDPKFSVFKDKKKGIVTMEKKYWMKMI
jgi:hypothetical protein